MTSLLPILDNFERAFKSNKPKENDGILLIYNQLKTIFESDIAILEDSKKGKTKEEIAEIDITIKNKKDELQDKIIAVLTDSKTRSESQAELLKELITHN